MNMLLKKSGNEFNGWFVSFTTDEADKFDGNAKMFRSNTVDDWYPEEVQRSKMQEHQWETLAKAPAKKSKGAARRARNAAKKAKELADSCRTIVYRPHHWMDAGDNEELATEDVSEQQPKCEEPSGPPEDWDTEAMLEYGFTDAHYQLTFDSDDEEEEEEVVVVKQELSAPVIDWDAGVSHTRRNSEAENWDQNQDDEPLRYDAIAKKWIWQ